MNRVMRDSTTAADIPLAGLSIAAGYGNGTYAWSTADKARFGAIPLAMIDVNGTDPAACGVLDVETGDATPDQAPGWVKQRHALYGDVPVIYCNRSTLTAVFNAMAAAGLKIVKDFRLWIATLDGTKTVPDMTGVVAVQYAGAKGSSDPVQTPGHYDESIVYDDTWHAAPKPPPPPVQREYVVVDLTAGGATFRAVSGMVLK